MGQMTREHVQSSTGWGYVLSVKVPNLYSKAGSRNTAARRHGRSQIATGVLEEVEADMADTASLCDVTWALSPVALLTSWQQSRLLAAKAEQHTSCRCRMLPTVCSGNPWYCSLVQRCAHRVIIAYIIITLWLCHYILPREEEHMLRGPWSMVAHHWSFNLSSCFFRTCSWHVFYIFTTIIFGTSQSSYV